MVRTTLQTLFVKCDDIRDNDADEFQVDIISIRRSHMGLEITVTSEAGAAESVQTARHSFIEHTYS